jgi:8-oxo-dGTP pyrophosphatase MutT (NUDIX family)
MGLFDGFRASIMRSSCANLPPEEVASAIVNGISSRPDAVQLMDALQVRLANRNPVPITMYGRQVVDTLPGADPRQRLSYELQPFAHMSQGAGVVIISRGPDGEDRVLLGKRSDGTGWGLPCGYSKVAPSFNAQGIFADDIGHTRDDFERALVAQGKLVADQPVNQLVNTRPTYDKTMEDTAIRETREEAGIDLRPDQLQFVYCNTYDGADKKQPRQNQTFYYLADLRKESILPPLVGTDDLIEPQWVNLSELKGQGKAMELRGMRVVEGEPIERAIGKMRENEYAAFGVTKEAIAKFSPTPEPQAVLSAEAGAWHQQALTIAASMNRAMQQIQRGNGQGPGCSV